jgi:hypothetical protein
MIQLSFFGCSPKKVSWVSSFADAKGYLFLLRHLPQWFRAYDLRDGGPS